MGVITPLSEQLTKPLPIAMVLVNSKELSTGAYKLLPEVEGFFPINCRRPNAHGGLHRPNNSTLQPLSNRYQKFSARIRASPLEEWEGRLNIGMSNNVTTSIREFIREMAIGRTKTTDRADRATVEKVFDFRTKFIIYKLMGRDVCKEINGCISTGKEANVYHATNSDGQERAIKVFKTSVLVFKSYCSNKG